MNIKYKDNFESQNIDLKKLRPNKSYDFLIKNRNSSLKHILSDKKKLKKLLIKKRCPVCNADNYNLVLKKDNLDIVKCKVCNVIYVNPIFNEEKYLELYRSKNYQKIVKRLQEDSHNYRRKRFGKERVNILEKFHNKKLKKRFLDIGCSTGFIIEEAKHRGWDSVGIELNPSAVKFARSRGLNVLDKPLEEVKFKKNFSDIGLFDVLEHLSNPKNILEEIHKFLYKDGNIYIYVPNWNSASRDLLGEKNSHFIWPTHHLTYFTPLTLKYFLEKNGFKVIYWETQGLDVYDWLWFLNEKTKENTSLIEKFSEQLQFYINSSGHGKNLRMYAKKK